MAWIFCASKDAAVIFSPMSLMTPLLRLLLIPALLAPRLKLLLSAAVVGLTLLDEMGIVLAVVLLLVVLDCEDLGFDECITRRF